MGGFGPLGFMGRELNLTDDQRAQIKAIFMASRQDDAPWRQQLEELRTQVHDAVVANGYDEKQVRALVQAKSPAMVEMAVHGIATLAKVRAVLTPEQQQKLEQLQANRPQGGGFGPPGFGPPGFGGPPAL
jgi:protein CpxP